MRLSIAHTGKLHHDLGINYTLALFEIVLSLQITLGKSEFNNCMQNYGWEVKLNECKLFKVIVNSEKLQDMVKYIWMVSCWRKYIALSHIYIYIYKHTHTHTVSLCVCVCIYITATSLESQCSIFQLPTQGTG